MLHICIGATDNNGFIASWIQTEQISVPYGKDYSKHNVLCLDGNTEEMLNLSYSKTNEYMHVPTHLRISKIFINYILKHIFGNLMKTKPDIFK